MAIVVFISFRTFVPSGAVVLSAFADMAMMPAAMNIIGIPFAWNSCRASHADRYSVDSDILLTNRVSSAGQAQ